MDHDIFTISAEFSIVANSFFFFFFANLVYWVPFMPLW